LNCRAERVEQDGRSSGAQWCGDASSADDAPKAEEPVKAQHHRSPTCPLDDDLLDVHRYVDRPEDCAEEITAEQQHITLLQGTAGDPGDAQEPTKH
jgi:hypothetical protein